MSSGPMGALVSIPEMFLHSIEHFVLAKLQAAQTSHVSFVEGVANLVRLLAGVYFVDFD